MTIKVLCVDDDPASLDVAKEFLEESGKLSVDTVTTAEEAIRRLAGSHYDVVISDYLMPRTNGLELLEMIRGKGWSVPFILMTGLEREEVIIEACNAGVTFYVRKGSDVEAQFVELEHKVRQAVARSTTEQELKVKQLQANMAMDLARIASWEYDPRADLFQFDDIFYQLYGTDAAREGGYHMSPEQYLKEFVHPDDRECSMLFMSQGVDEIAPGDYLEFKHLAVRRDGGVQRMLVRVGKMVDADGAVLRVYGINQVIEEL
jgi:CheY-like chemotaxis protein